MIVMDDGHIVMDGTPEGDFLPRGGTKTIPDEDVPQVTELAWGAAEKGNSAFPDGILRKSELLDALVPLLKEE